MKLQYEEQITEVSIPSKQKDIGISLSGGLDSSLLLFIICSIIEQNQINITLHPMTGNDVVRPCLPVVNKIIDWHKDKFNVIWADHIVWDNSRIHGKKIKLDSENMTKFCKQKNINYVFNGRTSNPPADIIEIFGGHYEKNRQHNRNLPTSIPTKWGTLIRPWNNVDKKFIAAMYKKFNCEELIKHTWSCIGYAEQTNNFTRPCGKCYWCKEKMWGFNQV